MYAIVDIAGKQFKVAKDQFIYAPKLEGEAGTAVNFSNVLLIDDGAGVQIGAPTLAGASVSGTILEHVKGNKVIVFKKKRRKGLGVKRKKTRRDADLNELLLVAHTRKLGPGVSVKRSTKLNSDELI